MARATQAAPAAATSGLLGGVEGTTDTVENPFRSGIALNPSGKV